MNGFVVWMTGLSGTGKSTLASLLTTELTVLGIRVESLDGDEVRKVLSHGLGFDREDRDRNVRRIGYVARMVARAGSCAITAAISPYRALRDEIRSKTENFIEVYCDCPIEVLTARDPKGLYKRALAGEIKNFTGVSDPYEAPENPEIHLRTDLSTPEECVEQIIEGLRARGLLSDGTATRRLPPAFGGEVFEARTLAEIDLVAATKKLEISQQLAEDVRFVAAGFVSPLTAFMTKRESHKVENSGALERGTPWWNTPFQLQLPPESDVAVGDTVLLTLDGEIVAQAACERVWTDGTHHFFAGPIEAVTLPMTPTARDIRRSLNAQKAIYASCLFSDSAPSDAAIEKLKFAAQLVDALVLAVSSEQLESWKLKLVEVPYIAQLFGVPKTIPISEGIARAVIAKSVGASKDGLL